MRAPRFHRDSRGFVHLRGGVACAAKATGGVLFKLPSRFAPSAREIFPIATSDGSGNIDDGAVAEVDPDGTVMASGNHNSGFISLSPIGFEAG